MQKGSVETMLIQDFFNFWAIWVIIGLMRAVFYGSLGGVLFTASIGLFVAGYQFPEHGSMLRIVSAIVFLCAIFFFYRAYISARWNEYQKQIEREPVAPPTDFMVVLLKRIKLWIKHS